MKINKWTIFRANLNPVIGSEQGKSRPVLIISESEINNLLNTVNIIPITSRKPQRRIYPNEVVIPANYSGLEKESILLCHQIRTIDKQRLSRKYGQIADTKIQIEIFDALCFQFGIDFAYNAKR